MALFMRKCTIWSHQIQIHFGTVITVHIQRTHVQRVLSLIFMSVSSIKATFFWEINIAALSFAEISYVINIAELYILL